MVFIKAAKTRFPKKNPAKLCLILGCYCPQSSESCERNEALNEFFITYERKINAIILILSKRFHRPPNNPCCCYGIRKCLPLSFLIHETFFNFNYLWSENACRYLFFFNFNYFRYMQCVRLPVQFVYCVV